MKRVAVNLLSSVALYWCQKVECGALQAADRTPVIGEGFRNFARNWVRMTQELRTASGRKMRWDSLQSWSHVQRRCEKHLDLPQIGLSVISTQIERQLQYQQSSHPNHHFLGSLCDHFANKRRKYGGARGLALSLLTKMNSTHRFRTSEADALKFLSAWSIGKH